MPELEDWQQFLSQAVLIEEGSVIADNLKLIDRCRTQLFNVSPKVDGILKLQVARTLLSHSLIGSPETLKRWEQANQFVFEEVKRNSPLTSDGLEQIQKMLAAPDKTGLRTQSVFSSGYEHPHPEQAEKLMGYFWSSILSMNEPHPLAKASRVRQWILSVHPFQDGNGRSAQLAADWILLGAGYPPLTFRDRLLGMVTGIPGAKNFMTPQIAFEKTVATVLDSYRILGAL